MAYQPLRVLFKHADGTVHFIGYKNIKARCAALSALVGILQAVYLLYIN